MPEPHEPETPTPGPLRPMLKAAQSGLAKHLDEACAHDDVNEESTAQLIRLEETLVDAAQAAKQAVSLRRRLGTKPGAHGASDAEVETADAAEIADRSIGDRRASQAPALEETSVREFRDVRGVLWRVWAVTPSRLHPERPLENRLGAYSDGWLAFETEDGSQRRRLAHHPAEWSRQTNQALEALLESAEPGRPRRKAKGGDAERSAD